MIRPSSIPLSFSIKKNTTLQNNITRAYFDTWRQVSRIKGRLFHIFEVVFRIFIQHQFPHWNQGKFLVRPDLGKKGFKFTIFAVLNEKCGNLGSEFFTESYLRKIEGIKWKSSSLLRRHDLNVKCPARILATSNGVVQIPNTVIRFFFGYFVCFFQSQILDFLFSL